MILENYEKAMWEVRLVFSPAIIDCYCSYAESYIERIYSINTAA